jgi:hypothetical protein
MEKRIFVSATANRHLDSRRLAFKEAVLGKIRQKGYKPQEFFESGIPERLAWNFDNVDRVMRQCVGAVVLGFPRWTTSDHSQQKKIIAEYGHYEGAIALTLGLPVLLLKEEGVEDRGIMLDGGCEAATTYVDNTADEKWVDHPRFVKSFNAWLHELEARTDIFLGYCSKSIGIAAQIQLHLQKLGVSVSNWAMDFGYGGSILDEIKKRCAESSCGIFLFSEDDPLKGTPDVAAPWDNVVFEAGILYECEGTREMFDYKTRRR